MRHLLNSVRLNPVSLAALALAAGLVPAAAADIKIGEVNSYSAMSAFTEPYRKGWEMGVAEVNAAGGINGDRLVIIAKDDGGKPGDAVTAANELLANEGVVMIAGGFLSNVGLALADFAKQKKVMYLATEPLTDAITWSNGNAYTFRLRPSNYMQVSMLVEEAAKYPARRWAIVAPNFEFGQSAVAVFKDVMKKKRPDIEIVAEQWPPNGKIDAGSVVQAIEAAKPDAIFNATYGADLVKFVREGNTRDLFKGRSVVSLLTGEPEYLDPLKAEAPDGWLVTGYPWYAITLPDHKKFVDAYEAKYHDYPRTGSLVGYSMVKSLVAILKKAGSTDTDKMIKAAEGVGVETPVGPIVFRAVDHQSTFGAFVGKTIVKDGKGIMVDFKYDKGEDYLPSVEETKKLRPQG